MPIPGRSWEPPSSASAATRPFTSILDVMSAKTPYTTLARTMHIHPTVSELIPTLLQEMTPLD